MPIYSQDVKLFATAYVVADNEEEAARIIAEHFGEGQTAELPTGYAGDFEISGAAFGEYLPEVSLSPAVTFYGPEKDSSPDYVSDDDGNEEEEDDGCPVGDPDCLGANGDCHDACEAPQ